MTTPADWVRGARPQTLPTAIAPVLTGCAAAVVRAPVDWTVVVLLLVTTAGLVVGVNFANDYSDGVRGTDDVRVGPLRLVGSGRARPAAVLAAAGLAFGIGAAAAVALAVLTTWQAVPVYLLCVAGAWFYTGGPKPYGYQGFGELAVFVYFGLVFVLGTQYVLAGRIGPAGVAGAVAIGCLCASILVLNNLRDIDTDAAAGKTTLAVRLGRRPTRTVYLALLATAAVCTALMAVESPFLLVSALALPLFAVVSAPVRHHATGTALIPPLRGTALAMLVWSALLLTGALLTRYQNA